MKSLILKMLVLAVVMIVLLIASLMIRGVVEDRRENRSNAEASISRGLAGEQTIAGVAMDIVYVERYKETVKEYNVSKTVNKEVAHTVNVLPDKLVVNGDMALDPRYRGVFKINGYIFRGKLEGSLSLPKLEDFPRDKRDSTLEIKSARIAMGIADPRGIRKLSLLLNDSTLEAESGTGNKAFNSGVSASVHNVQTLLGKTLPFSAELQLVGTNQLDIVPLGTETTARISSPWPHPSFDGSFLPIEKHVSEGGFEATWSVNALASSAQQAWWEGRSASQQGLSSFSVALIDPVDIYRLSDRASKYAQLFIILTLGAFLVFEVVRRLRVHPLNYLLIGFALLMFFLLLLALSEHLGFDLSYLIASGACVLLITAYVINLLRSPWAAGIFGLSLAGLYGALYAILQSEQNALLMGTILLFAILAGVMLGTRKIDWNQIFSDASRTREVEQEQMERALTRKLAEEARNEQS